MTITYTAEVATCEKFGCFIKLLGRWRGSIYKIIWMDLLLFLTLYYCINFMYLHLLEDESQRTFESIVYYCASYTSIIPLSFVLGFYVNLVMSRWWDQYITIPWPDSIAVFVSAYVHGQDEGGRLMRRTVMRYVCLCLTIVFTMISPCVKKRFPKLKNLIDAGLLLENEKKIIEAMDNSFPKYPKHWLPIVWAASIITRARKEGRIRDDFAVKTIIDELNSFRGRCGTLMYFDFISIPLVYTQVVTIAVYSFFACSLLAHQWTYNKKDTYEAFDFYSPVFITLQFFFYMGWLKVAETLINPFGEDDDDFEVNWMIDRNLQVSYLIVDEMHHEHPELVRDQYWDEVYPNELPYESEAKREQPPEPSTAKYDMEDLIKETGSKATSLPHSVIENGKIRSSLQNSLNQRSQTFNEAFERFLNFSENDTMSLRTDMENSFLSLADIENIEHITSYLYPNPIEFESQLESENVKERSVLEPIMEEGEEVSEVIEEEEMPIMEEEEDQIESHSSHHSGPDSDPFERLRTERQQQRLQRMTEYLERHFGSNFRVIAQSSATPELKTALNTLDLKSDKSLPVEEINKENLKNDDNLLTSIISTYYLNLEDKSASSREILVPQTSTASMQIKTKTEKMSHDEIPEGLKENERLVPLNLPEKTSPSKTLLLIEDDDKQKISFLPSVKPVSFEQSSVLHTEQELLEKGSQLTITRDMVSKTSPHSHSIQTTGLSEPQENILTNLPVSLERDFFSPLQLKQGSSRSLINLPNKSLEHFDVQSKNVPTSSRNILKGSSSTPQIQSRSIKLTEGSGLSTINLSPQTIVESIPLLISKGTSPLSSARSMSTESSTEDWEIVPLENSSVTGEYRVEIEDPGDDNHFI